MKKWIWTIFIIAITLSLSALQANAQSKVVKGTVYDSDGQTTLPGVTVLHKGTTNGLLSGLDGGYTITVSGEQPVLEFRLLGYETQEIEVGSKTEINVVMRESSRQLDEVVVTALGLTRDQKSLGYAVTKIGNEELTSTSSSNWMNAINGKVAGLTLSQAGTGPGGSTRVTIRGNNSLDHANNEALFVIDGVPVNSGSIATGNGSNYANVDSPVDFGSGASELNPDDIESVTILKGPAASALYGSRAANGAIIITTKSGKKEKGLGITVTSSAVYEQAGFWPDFQKEYGSGGNMGEEPFNFWAFPETMTLPDGSTVRGRSTSRYAFGEKYDPDKLRYLYTSKDWDNNTYTPVPFVYQDDWYTGLFRTGATYRNNISILGNNGAGTTSRFSFTDERNEWILPNTGYQQQTFSLSFETEMNKVITLRAMVNYLHKQSDNLPNPGYGESNVLYNLTWGYPVNSINVWKDEYFKGRYNRVNWEDTQSGVADGGHSLAYIADNRFNPFRSLYEETNSMDRNRVYGNATLAFKLARGLTLDLRSGIDLASDLRKQQKPFMTFNRLNGFYREQTYQLYKLDNDFMLQYENNSWANERLGFKLMLGGSNMHDKYYRQQTTLENLNEEGVYNTNNARTGTYPIPNHTFNQKIINSLYGMGSLSWDGTYYLDITARNDWSSTLARSNWSYFYPSVSASILLDEAFDFATVAPWINFLKLRLSWANVGNDTNPYALDRNYAITDYSGGYRLPTTIPDPLIKPENVESWEAGVEAKFLDSRISLDVAVYKIISTNQILNVSTDWATGASNRTINAGELQNKGLEISGTIIPVKTRDFTWSMNFNWDKNVNTLVKLQDDWDPLVPFQTNPGTTIGSRTYIYSFVGQEMDYIYGKGFQKAPEGASYIDENGNRVDASGMDIVNATNGFPVLDAQPDRRIGKVNPDWRAGMGQQFRYKNLSLSVFFTGQWGGNTYSVTNFALGYIGKLKSTLPGRYDGLVHPGVNETVNPDGSITYTKNTTVTENIATYYSTYMFVRDNTEMNTFDTSFLKFKEARLDYKIPPAWLVKTGFLHNANIGVYATNIFCWTDFPQYDPEAGMISGNQIYKGIEAMAFPMTRTYGVNLKFSF
ncbi:MAG: SusC/RagA family TonB-linked outer membrane protein [Tannerella sp.]|jgi:TonB-linked SusC/RagA family outer membrane protein|nr:SusC/RagA family TonB-linked outer membrane protein [Tannerella sp.]